MADKKLLEESTIRRFMQLANIKPSESGVLTEAVHAGGNRDQAGGVKGAERLSNVGVRGGVSEKKKVVKKADQEDLEETVDEEKMEEAHGYEEGLEEAEGEGDETGLGDVAGDVAGDEMGAESEGGDLESAVEGVVESLNTLLSAIGMGDKSVELEADAEEEGEEESGEDMAASEEEEETMDQMQEAPVMERKKKHKEEELEESIELVDDTLVEKLLQRVSARLVSEARKSRELAESKKGWGKVPSKSASHKSSTKGKGPGKGTPFTKSVSVKGTAGRGR